MTPTEDEMDKLNDVIRRLRSELERVRRVAADYFDTITALREAGWREMETAPTNGQSVLLFCPRARDYGYARIRLTWRKDGLWQGANNTLWPPTHWMPLPDGPETQQPGERGE